MKMPSDLGDDFGGSRRDIQDEGVVFQGLFECDQLAGQHRFGHEVSVAGKHALAEKLRRSFQINDADFRAGVQLIPIGLLES